MSDTVHDRMLAYKTIKSTKCRQSCLGFATLPAGLAMYHLITFLALATAAGSQASSDELYHPYLKTSSGPRSVDFSRPRHLRIAAPVVQPDLAALDQPARPREQVERTGLPEGWIQQGNVVVPSAVASGELQISPRAIAAVEDIPGNEYPRKHTVYMNFNGGMLWSGADNSAENRSTLAAQGDYPTFSGGEATALAAVQSFEQDVSQFGIRVLAQERPSKTVPYTMVMVGGSWTDTNLEDPAGGVAPGTDCGALGQRHVVYVFANSGWGGVAIANVTSQEAGHAWGLDHSYNCNSVMAYCGGGDKFFSNTCDGVCEFDCQGVGGCFAVHDDFCGEDSGNQNEAAELGWIFGGNEPDLEPPTVVIDSPLDGGVYEVGASVPIRAVVDDNYGGYAWKFIVKKDDVLEYDEVDYDRDVDDDYRAALNLVNLEAGVYEVTVEAEDHADHVTRQTVTITVEGPSDTEGSSTSGSDSGDSGTGEGPGSSSGAMTSFGDGATTAQQPERPMGTGSATNGSGQTDAVEGCGCTTDSGGKLGWGLVVLGLLALGRRRSH